MKSVFVIVFYIIIIISCEAEKSPIPDAVQKTDSAKAISFNPPVLEETYYRKLYKFQQEIMLNPEDREKKERFIFNAYFAENNTLLSFGSARKTNPKTQQAIPYPLLKRAALVDAKRWATYGLLWINNDFKPDFGRINDIHSGESREVFNFDIGDSLIIALANKVH